MLAALAALAAVFAPASLTGSDLVDMVQRGVIAGLVTYVGAHGRRRTWLVVGALVAVPSGGISMALTLAGLAIAVASTLPAKRSRRYGAAVVGCYVNAILWYPPHEAPWGVAIAIVAIAALVVSGLPMMRGSKRRVLAIGFGAAAGFAVVACILVAVATLLAGSAVRSGGDAATGALEAARNGDRDEASALLSQAGDDFDPASGHLDRLLPAPARVVPGAAQQLH
ncbi:MAG: hypothetical protein KDA94_15005, partial [Acidimicrobiales bacterium]|nr:hypothetical protein [Acidimicrobiales bacterium]